VPLALTLLLALGAGGGATEALRARDAEIRAALPPAGREPTGEERRRLGDLVARAVDLPGMVEAALGPRWKELSPPQRRRLTAAFERRFREASTAELSTYRSSRVEYLPEQDLGGGRIRVATRVEVDGEPTEVAYALRRGSGGWRIVDLAVDGVSTVENYRASFARIIAREGVDALIGRLERGAPERP
jgi:phospholipid transport system substrate-binding protein